MKYDSPVAMPTVFVPKGVSYRYRDVKWNDQWEKLFTEAVGQQISGDDWDSTTEEERNILRSFWYHGYIIGGASAGSY